MLYMSIRCLLLLINLMSRQGNLIQKDIIKVFDIRITFLILELNPTISIKIDLPINICTNGYN